jgi:transcription antitermination factor NusG
MWGVLQVAPNGEHQACEFLRSVQVEAYAPRFPAPRRTKPGSVRHRRRRWVFPGYVFFKIGPDSTPWNVIRGAAGVRRVLQSDGSPATVGDQVIDHLNRRLAEGSIRESRSAFVRGQFVHIEHGPLAAVDAIFDRELDRSDRVQILISLFGRQLPLTIDPKALRATG